ncbi:hypothetical protein I316_01157 [Kwoniella heveanensis BCC8398]|uniref:Uncharacterized protein n=1 Tax=Kwoniella heveanensis BCC8398 TaxID=1296120 RepID=A0A1B9H1U6_9TREE|nr:hypothetical protein I316_01157 [Kwoniella heveanensis BCC8398]
MSTDPNQPQPEASSSTAPNHVSKPKHIATFVFDSSLPQKRYKKLIQAEGVVHKLVQRLVEKHGGENNIRLCLLITASASSGRSRSSPTTKTVLKQEYTRLSMFLTSLPKMVNHFTKEGRESSHSWPGFSVTDRTASLVKSRKRSRRNETGLLDGVSGGLELLNRPTVDIRHSPSRTFISLTPAAATPLLDEIHTPQSHEHVVAGSPPKRYLVVLAKADQQAESNEKTEEAAIRVDDSWDEDRDGRDWNSLTQGCREQGVRCSCVVAGHDSGGASKKLKAMCQEAVSGNIDAPWFDVAPDLDLVLSGFALTTADSSGTTPPLDMASSVATEQIETPISNPAIAMSSQADTKNHQQLQNQAMQARMAQFARAVSSAANGTGKIDPQVMQNMLAAMKSGNGQIDMNDPRWQQVRQLLQLQQQRQAVRSNQSQNGNANAIITPNSNPSVVSHQLDNGQPLNKAQQDQNLMAAIQQQRAQQAMNPPQQVTPQQTAPQPTPPLLGQNQQAIWSGTMSSWTGPSTGSTPLLSVDAVHFTGAAESAMSHQWPNDLKLRTVVMLDTQALTNYAKSKSSPIILFTPSRNSSDPIANVERYNQLANSLHAKGNMVVIPIGASDRGIVLFAAPSPGTSANPNGSRSYRLMGVVCLHVPFPPLNPSSQQTPSQTQIIPTALEQPPLQVQQIPHQMLQQSQQLQQQQQLPQQPQQFRPSPVPPNANPNVTALYQQQMMQAQAAAQAQVQAQAQAQAQAQLQGQPQQLQQMNMAMNAQQQQPIFANQPSQQQQIPQQQQQQQQPEKRGLTQQQFTQLIMHAQRLGVHIPPFDHNTILASQVQNIVNDIKIADTRHKAQQMQMQSQQHLQQQQQQSLQTQAQQQQMQQLQHMLGQQGQGQGQGQGQMQGQVFQGGALNFGQ